MSTILYAIIFLLFSLVVKNYTSLDMSTIFIAALILLFSLMANNVYKFYSNLKAYPPGPLPLPLIGNILNFVQKRHLNPCIAIHECCKSYGKMCTFWFGTRPMIVIRDADIAKNAFTKLECSGRPLNVIHLGGINAYLTQDYSHEIEILRKLSLEAIRQLLLTKKLSAKSKESVYEVITAIKKNENNRSFNSMLYMRCITIKTMVAILFGKTYSYDDKQLEFLHHSMDVYHNESFKSGLSDYFPIMKHFIKPSNDNETIMNGLRSFGEDCFRSVKKDYKIGMCDNISHSLLAVRKKMIDDCKDDAKYLTDVNLNSVLLSLLIAGTDTSIHLVNWMVLFIANFPEIQLKLRKEVKTVLGYHLPELQDKNKFHYLNAFIAEVFRFRPVGLFAPHKTLEAMKISDYSIPKDTYVFLDIYGTQNSTALIPESENYFSPQRFLDSSGIFNINLFPSLMPFSSGRRKCVGEKIALNSAFIVLVSLLQATEGHQFVLENWPQKGDLDYGYDFAFTVPPKPYQITLKPN